MLSLAKSHLTLMSRLCFLATNALGLLLGTIYQARTPDLYPNNAHGKIGWIATWLVSSQLLMNLVNRAASAHIKCLSGSLAEMRVFIPVSLDHVGSECRVSDDSGQVAELLTGSLSSQSARNLGERVERDVDDERPPLSNSCKEYGLDDSDDLLPPAPATALTARAAKLVFSKAWGYLDVTYQVFDRVILPFGFVALTTGIATFGRLFVSWHGPLRHHPGGFKPAFS